MGKGRKGFIAVHVGAGQHSSTLGDQYKKVCQEACKQGLRCLQERDNVLDAVVRATTILEDSPLTNAGFGSNLNYEGNVECDASVMEGTNFHFGSVGAISGIKNPIHVAGLLCRHQADDIGHGRIPPSFLVGDGAASWAKEMGVHHIPTENLISEKAKKIYKHYKRKIESDNSNLQPELKKRLDTVGAICVDEEGNVASACSSGGIILKYPGRVGQAAVYGCGVWADKGKYSIGTSTTGAGEHLVRTFLARTVADSIADTDCPTTSLHDAMQKEFIESRYLRDLKQKLGGVIAVRYSVDEEFGDFLWSHSTNTMIISYMNSNGQGPVSHMSVLPNEDVGKKVLVEGVCFKLPKSS